MATSFSRIRYSQMLYKKFSKADKPAFQSARNRITAIWNCRLVKRSVNQAPASTGFKFLKPASQTVKSGPTVIIVFLVEM